ncbi:MAG: SUMF1/EgtB/PvdO family nonheme iron enzyme [Bacteroidota bacterium]
MKPILIIAFAAIVFVAKANNVSLTNVSVANNAAGTGKVVQFDLSWENSWRTSSTNNHDGVWIFFKFKDVDGKWYPLRFNGNNNVLPAGFTQDPGNNGTMTGVGMFIYRSANGFGTSTVTAIRAGIQSVPGTFEVKGFAIEMVYIPQGAFWLGDGASEDAYQNSNVGNLPFQVTGNGGSITGGTATGTLYDPEGINSGNYAGYPAGYSPYWMMKYELSQGAYRDFLNTLTYAQQVSRTNTPPNSAVGTNYYGAIGFRQHIEIATPGSSPTTPAVYGCDADGDNNYNETNDGEWVTLTGLNWTDCAAFLDWAGLRPMTEFEFEKACRGPLDPVANEYAWGTDGIAGHAFNLTNSSTASEGIANPSAVFGNAITDSSNISLARGGIFATAISNRISSGAGYYGVMELTGSLNEMVVASHNTAGRSFNGKHGDGYLTTPGNANENYWPGVNGATGNNVSPGIYDGGNGVVSDGGMRTRGGHAFSVFLRLKVSDRFGQSTGTTVLTTRGTTTGIRGVRDAN